MQDRVIKLWAWKHARTRKGAARKTANAKNVPQVAETESILTTTEEMME